MHAMLFFAFITNTSSCIITSHWRHVSSHSAADHHAAPVPDDVTIGCSATPPGGRGSGGQRSDGSEPISYRRHDIRPIAAAAGQKPPGEIWENQGNK